MFSRFQQKLDGLLSKTTSNIIQGVFKRSLQNASANF